MFSREFLEESLKEFMIFGWMLGGIKAVIFEGMFKEILPETFTGFRAGFF